MNTHIAQDNLVLEQIIIESSIQHLNHQNIKDDEQKF